MKINAKEERPKIHFLVILTIIAAALILYLIFWAREAHPIAVCSIAIAYFSAVVISLVAAFFRQIRFNLYSYNSRSDLCHGAAMAPSGSDTVRAGLRTVYSE